MLMHEDTPLGMVTCIDSLRFLLLPRFEAANVNL